MIGILTALSFFSPPMTGRHPFRGFSARVDSDIGLAQIFSGQTTHFRIIRIIRVKNDGMRIKP